MKKLLVATMALSFLGGCAGAYTSIRKVDDKSYVVTRVKAGFFRQYGTVFNCTVVGDSPNLQCTEIDSP
jgi:hypothetical protein